MIAGFSIGVYTSSWIFIQGYILIKYYSRVNCSRYTIILFLLQEEKMDVKINVSLGRLKVRSEHLFDLLTSSFALDLTAIALQHITDRKTLATQTCNL